MGIENAALAARAAAGQPHACNLQTRIGPHSAWVRVKYSKLCPKMSVYYNGASTYYLRPRRGVAYYNEFVPHVGTIVSRYAAITPQAISSLSLITISGSARASARASVTAPVAATAAAPPQDDSPAAGGLRQRQRAPAAGCLWQRIRHGPVLFSSPEKHLARRGRAQ